MRTGIHARLRWMALVGIALSVSAMAKDRVDETKIWLVPVYMVAEGSWQTHLKSTEDSRTISLLRGEHHVTLEYGLRTGAGAVCDFDQISSASRLLSMPCARKQAMSVEVEIEDPLDRRFSTRIAFSISQSLQPNDFDEGLKMIKSIKFVGAEGSFKLLRVDAKTGSAVLEYENGQNRMVGMRDVVARDFGTVAAIR